MWDDLILLVGCIALMLSVLLMLSLRTRPKSRLLRVLSRIFFAALSLFVLHRMDPSLPALNAVSLGAVSTLGPIGYALLCFVRTI